MNISSSRLEAMKWLYDELHKEYAKTQDFRLYQEFLQSLDGIERKWLLENIFGSSG